MGSTPRYDRPEPGDAQYRPGAGIHFLENDEARIGPAHFLGATLWTDFQLYGADGYAPAPMSCPYNRCRTSATSTGSATTSPRAEHRLHRASRDWLAGQLARPRRRPDADGQPPRAQCALSIPPQFVGNPLSPAFASQPRRTGGAGRLLAARSRPRALDYPSAGHGCWPIRAAIPTRGGGFVRNSSSRSEPQRGNWLKKRQISAGASVPGRSCRIRGKRWSGCANAWPAAMHAEQLHRRMAVFLPALALGRTGPGRVSGATSGGAAMPFRPPRRAESRVAAYRAPVAKPNRLTLPPR